MVQRLDSRGAGPEAGFPTSPADRGWNQEAAAERGGEACPRAQEREWAGVVTDRGVKGGHQEFPRTSSLRLKSWNG